MRRSIFFYACAVFCLTISAIAQTPAPVKVKIRAALYDRDLNLKPVPRMTVNFANLDNPQATPVTTQTTLDGVGEVELTAGRYRLTTGKPAELFGKAYRWDFEIKITKPDQLIELSNDNATTTELAGSRAAHVDELVEQYKTVKESVVTVWTEDSVGDGTLIDKSGLVLTSRRLIDGHKWLAVQYGDTVRVATEVVADDNQHDAAILRVNMEPLQGAFVVPISTDPGALVEGERVFTIDNNLRKGKSIATGVVSKASNEEINSDVKFTDDGSPLFNSSGMLVGFSDWSNKEYRIIPLIAVKDMIASARNKAANTPAPSARLLPSRPVGKFPADVLIARHESEWEKDIYWFKLGDFEVDIQTPVALYQYNQQHYYYEQKQRMKMKNAQSLPKLTEPEHVYLPVWFLVVSPQYKMPFWANMGNSGREPVIIRPKSSFNRMRLLCGGKEVEPIWPRRTALGTGENRNVRVDQNSMQGAYEYGPDAISPSCGQVTLEVYPDGSATPLTKTFDANVVERIYKDFDGYRAAQTKKPATSEAK